MLRRSFTALLGALAVALVLGGALHALIRNWLLPLLTRRGATISTGLAVGCELTVAILPTAIAGYLIARWAPRSPYRHAAFLGAFLMGAGALAWPRTLAGSASAGLPGGYPYFLILLRFGSALAGAFLFTALQKQPREAVGA